MALPRPNVILLQLPPAVPTMLACRLAAQRHRARLVFDWHNFAYTLMALGMGRSHPVVSERPAALPACSPGCLPGTEPHVHCHQCAPTALRFSKLPAASRALPVLPCYAALQVRLAERYERHWGRTADASLCVTRAMQLELQRHWRVPAAVFYDRPPDFFRPASLQARRFAAVAAGGGGIDSAAE